MQRNFAITEFYNIYINYFDPKKSARKSRLFVVTELVVSGTQCNHTRRYAGGYGQTDGWTNMQAHFATIHDSQHKRKARLHSSAKRTFNGCYCTGGMVPNHSGIYQTEWISKSFLKKKISKKGKSWQRNFVNVPELCSSLTVHSQLVLYLRIRIIKFTSTHSQKQWIENPLSSKRIRKTLLSRR